MTREKPKAATPQGESIDTAHRGGVVRSSEEVAVMAMERRDGVIQQRLNQQPQGRIQQSMQGYTISKQVVYAAWLRVKANGGAAGADNVSIGMFENNLKNELYKLWNRMNSGSYMAPPVKRVEIEKPDGRKRPLGIPTVADRIAQMVVKMALEPGWDRKFHPSSFGYRPHRSAHHAVQAARKNCWKYHWAIDIDIKGFFDNLSHEHLLRFVAEATEESWCKLYIERWIKADVILPNGERRSVEKGTPQGGVISPLLANLYLHKVFDSWMQKYFPESPFERYADDIIVHCKTEAQANRVLTAVAKRMMAFQLTLHPDKTKIVYCGRASVAKETVRQFDFLGFTFHNRAARDSNGDVFTGFLPAISNKAKKSIVRSMRLWSIRSLTLMTLAEVSKKLNPQIMGWINYYGAFYKTAMNRLMDFIEFRLVRWAQVKYPKRLTSTRRATEWLNRIKSQCPRLFSHWQEMRTD